jgi:hypothetical protein
VTPPDFHFVLLNLGVTLPLGGIKASVSTHKQKATSMERFVVTRTSEDLWSVSYDGETFATYPTEKEAFSETFTRAAERRRAGFEVVVVLTRTGTRTTGHSLIDALGVMPPA